MRTVPSRMIARFSYAPAIAASIFLFATSSAAVAGTPQVAKAQAMSPKALIDRWTPFIKEASRRFGVAEDWIKAVMRMESGGRTALQDGKPITSKAGAVGIMQLMPATYRDMRQQYGLGADPTNPRDNVLAGTAYLRWLYEKYGFPKMFAAYNAGPGTIEARLASDRNLPDETRAYVSSIAHILGKNSSLSDAIAAPRLVKVIATAQSLNPLTTLTRPDGVRVSIDAAAVDSLRAPLPDEYAPGVRSTHSVTDALR
jgi:soluble lytic murein transglycosylase-like protein